MHVLAGNDEEEIVFPYTLKEIGRYIFYGCGNLKKLEFSDSLMQIGCGAFTGCHALEKLTVHMRQGKKSGVKEMLGEMWQRIDVNFLYEYEEARLVFPEHYDEAVENTPARILYTEYHGSGSNYRQCFYDKELNYQEYDRLFEMAVAMDKLEVLVDMSFGRLEFPYELTGKARENYREYIRKNLHFLVSPRRYFLSKHIKSSLKSIILPREDRKSTRLILLLYQIFCNISQILTDIFPVVLPGFPGQFIRKLQSAK